MTECILVTGGAGYVGSHACKALAQAGYMPISYDNLSRGHEWAVKWGPLARGDICDTVRMTEVLRQYAPTAVLHFAAFAYVSESVALPLDYYQNNVAGTLSLLRAMQNSNVRRLVFSSSCATYGVPETLPIVESARQQPINPYGKSKLMCEQIIADQCAATGLTASVLRYFNAAGADPEGEIGAAHCPETRLVPIVLSAAEGKIEHVTVFGDDYDTRDGTCVRDYVHVTDLAAAHRLAVERSATSTGWDSFNLGSGSGTSVAELIRAAECLTGASVPIKVTNKRIGDPAELVADPTNAKITLGWCPQHSDIDAILRSARNWMLREPVSIAPF